MKTQYPERTFTFERHADLPTEGPWVDEPDKIQWVDQATDLDCLIVRNLAGALCGYVGVPEGHPAHGLGSDQLYDLIPSLGVHGGVNFAHRCNDGVGDEAVCHVPYEGRPESVWWFGFDCAHAFDTCPGTQQLLAQFGRSLSLPGEVYRDVPYVKDQVKLLAMQLAAAK